MPTVLLIGGGRQSGQSVSVSLERTPLILSHVREALPQLKKELSKKWPVLWVGIEDQKPRLRNPHDPHAIISAARIVLTVRFISGEVARAAIREVLDYVRNWIKSFGHRKVASPRSKPKTTRRKSSTKKRRARRKLPRVRKRV